MLDLFPITPKADRELLAQKTKTHGVYPIQEFQHFCLQAFF